MITFWTETWAGVAAALILFVAGFIWNHVRSSKLHAAHQTLIDQLQEEVSRKESSAATERAHLLSELEKLNQNLDRMFADKAASREYVGALKDHIWQRLAPPPPEPPMGYMP